LKTVEPINNLKYYFPSQRARISKVWLHLFQKNFSCWAVLSTGDAPGRT